MFHMDEDKQQKVLKNFEKIVRHRDVRLINKDLYYHLNINCNFDAYFNLDGFRQEYSGEEGFQRFMEFFIKGTPASEWINAPEICRQYDGLNQAMFDYVAQNYHPDYSNCPV